MKNSTSLPCRTIGLIWLTTLASAVPAQSPSRSAEPIPMSQLGAKAGAQYQGNGLSVAPMPEGARLRCVFQKLEGQVTREGLWLTSTVEPQAGEKFGVVVRSVGREGALAALPPQGTVSVADKLARYARPGLTEEYSVSVDGVRQDFVVMQRPAGNGPLRVELDVTGAKVEELVNGARLVLAGSGRKIAYSRLHVVDAGGNTLTARMEVASATRLAVVLDDAGAVYPVRLDPTFSDANWASMGGLSGVDGGEDGTVLAAVVDSLGYLYIGGRFTIAGDVFATNIAKWNGSVWSALGSGMNSGVNALAVSGTNLYAGGYFTAAGGVSANRIAKWNGISWSDLGSGINGNVFALVVWGSDLYAGGNFTSAGGVSASSIAKWDGNAWATLGLGMGGSYPFVDALAVSGTNLYAGGVFATAGGVGANNIAKWDGSTWSAVGSGMGGSSFPCVRSLAVSGSDLYAGGEFTTAGGVSANYIAEWNGSVWSALGSGMGFFIYAMAVSGTNLYAGGGFSTAGGVSANHIAKWNGSAWSSLGSGIDAYVYALTVSGSDLYAGGGFSSAGGFGAKSIAKWNGVAWSIFGSGTDSEVHALAMSDTNLYAGGYFTIAGGVSASRIATWNGNAWSALGSGMNGGVTALAMSGSDLYVGGEFTTAAGVSANRIAKWNGSNWSALGSGVDFWVRALVVSGTNLYAGGWFTMAGGVRANHIAKWNGSAWSALGSGMDGGVLALAVSGSDVYAGGSFTYATNAGPTAVLVNGIAKWNGSAWSALGSGMSSNVNALAVSGSDLYAGGLFIYATNAGPTAVLVNSIAKWNGSAWSALGSGMNNKINALAVLGSELYAGGYFTNAGGVNANFIAKWDGNVWSALGSGMGRSWRTYYGVSALVASRTDLYAGGDFITAGDKVSAYLARAILSGEPQILTQPVSQTVTGGSTADFSVTASGVAPLSYQWSKNSIAVTDGVMPSASVVSGSGTTNLTITNVQTNDAGNYTVVVTNAYGSVTSSVAVLTVIPPLQLGMQPQSRTNIAGTTASFTVQAIGDQPLVFQWWKDGVSLLSGGRISGATSTNLTIANVQPSDAGDYTIVVSNSFGTVTSSVAVLTVTTPPQITMQPQSRTKSAGTTASLTVQAIGDQPLVFQWWKDGVALLDGGRISGASATNLAISNVQISDAGSYTVVVTNTYGSVTSQVALLTVTSTNAPTALNLLDYYYPIYAGNQWIYDSQQDSSSWTTLCRIDAVNQPLTCYTGRNPVSTYSRMANLVLFDQGDSRWTNYLAAGDDGWGYVGTDHDGGQPRLRFDAGFVFTNRMSLGQTISQTNDIYAEGVYSGQGTFAVHLTDLVDVTVPAGSFPDCLHLEFTYTIGGSTTVDEMWWGKGTGPVRWTHGKPGATSLEVNELRTASFVSPPRITVPPQSQFVSVASAVNFSIETLGDTPLSYQWRRNGTNLSNGGNLSGVTTTNLMIANIQASDVGNYTVVVTNAYGSVTSSVATLTIHGGSSWAIRVASTSLTDDELAMGLATDTAGNLYVSGWFDNTNDFGGTTLTSYGGQDAFVAKYNSVGNLQWVRQAGGTGPDWDCARGVGVDAAGNVYVTGGFLGTATFGGSSLTSLNNEDCFLAKYDSAGTLQWVRQGSDSWHSAYGTGIAVDNSGNSLVVGYFEGQTVSFGSITATNPGYASSSYATFMVKYNSAGTVQWARGLGGGETYSTTVGMDTAGNCYVAGSFKGTLQLGTTNLTSAGDKDGFLAKFNSTGVLQWARQVAGISSDGGRLGVDDAGNSWFVGNFTGSASIGPTNLTNSSGYGLFVARYDTSGNLQWVRQADSAGFLGTEGGCAIDASGNCYIPGIYSATVSFGNTVITNRGGWDIFAAKYDSTGNFQWVQAGGGTGNDGAFRAAVDTAGNCYVAGWFQGTALIGTNSLVAQGYWDTFVARIAAPAQAWLQFCCLSASNGICQMRLNGTPGASAVVDTSPDLKTWTPWQTNTLPAGGLPLAMPMGTNRQFFRARIP